MGRLSLALLCTFIVTAGPAGRAQPQPAAAPPAIASPAATTAGPGVYAVTYFEVAPASARKVSTALRQFAATARKEPGNAELTLLHEIGRPGRFAIVEAWNDKAAFEAHGAAMKALAERLHVDLTSPFEGRQFASLSVAPAAGAAATPAGAIYVLTHLDVFPAGKDAVAAMVREQTEESRKDTRVQRFDAVVWDGHPNHFQLIEVWGDRPARDAHVLAEHTRQFRTKVTPFEGAFYDERLYETVK